MGSIPYKKGGHITDLLIRCHVLRICVGRNVLFHGCALLCNSVSVVLKYRET